MGPREHLERSREATVKRIEREITPVVCEGWCRCGVTLSPVAQEFLAILKKR